MLLICWFCDIGETFMKFLKQLEWRLLALAVNGSALALFWAGCAAPGPSSTSPGTPAPAVATAPAVAPTPPVAAAPQSAHWSGDWTPLFDGNTLTHWNVTDFAGHGAVSVQDHQIKIGIGEVLSGINWTNGPLPTNDYEISVEAMKVDGGDFFCGLTFPVGDSWCSLIVGGWGGSVMGLSSLDGSDASENETTKTFFFDVNHWYHIRVQVRSDRIRTWLDDAKVIDVSIVGRRVDLRAGPIYLSKPLGVAAYETAAALRDFKLRTIQGEIENDRIKRR
jgi:hypothetical protein